MSHVMQLPLPGHQFVKQAQLPGLTSLGQIQAQIEQLASKPMLDNHDLTTLMQLQSDLAIHAGKQAEHLRLKILELKDVASH